MDTLTREQLPADPTEAYSTLEQQIDATRRTEQHLLALRRRILREVAGTQRGGLTRAAKLAGISDVQVGRLLVEDLAAAVRDALAGWDEQDYSIRTVGQRHPARVALSLPDDTPWPEGGDEEQGDRRGTWIRRMNEAGACLDALHKAGLAVEPTGDATDVRRELAAEREVLVTWA